MTRDDLVLLVDFHFWAVERMLEAVDPLTADQFTQVLGGSFASVRDTLSHMQGAEWIWMLRFRGDSPTTRPGPERFGGMADVRAAWTETASGLRALVDETDEDGFARVIEYRLLNGQAGASRLDHMLQHVVNHGSYHRGQVTTLLRQLGAAPPAQTDLIAFHRERGLAR